MQRRRYRITRVRNQGTSNRSSGKFSNMDAFYYSSKRAAYYPFPQHAVLILAGV
ncbi:hypothetical protein JOD69_004030 [Methylocaldum sp. RMAD-M]|jgi:hypothetical protein|nr:hypothetical protein [Methylocaldum sp. RMAD-M]